MSKKMGINWCIIDFFFLFCDCVSLLNPYNCDGWGGYVLCLYLIDWDASYFPLFEIILCTCIDMRLSISWVRRDRSCRYMDVASPPWVLNSRCISKEYHVYTIERVLDILRHIISWCHIALHLITSFILADYILYWWLYITWTWLIKIDLYK